MARYEAPSRVVSLGAAWAGNSVNCVPFRCSGVLSHGGVQHAGFYDAAGNVVVASIADGRPAARVAIATRDRPFDAHKAISLGLTRDGCLHLAYGAHDSAVMVARTPAPGLAGGIPEPAPLAGAFAAAATYPAFLSTPASAEPILLFRNGRAAAGEIRTMRYDGAAGLWRDDPVALISGLAAGGWQAGPYLNTPAPGPDGRVTLFVVWRLPAEATSAGAVCNSGIDCVVASDELRRLATAGGIDLALPVTPATAERVVAVPLGANLMNQASAAVRADGAPMVATWWNDADGVPQYRLGWREGGTWRTALASRFATRFRLDGGGTLPLPHSRPELLLDADGTAHLLFRSREWDGRLVATSLTPPDYALSGARHRILVDEDLGFYEPVLDRRGWDAGELTLHVQWCHQQTGGDRLGIMIEAEARLMSWPRGRLR